MANSHEHRPEVFNEGNPVHKVTRCASCYEELDTKGDQKAAAEATEEAVVERATEMGGAPAKR